MLIYHSSLYYIEVDLRPDRSVEMFGYCNPIIEEMLKVQCGSSSITGLQ